jgi:SAM-dependent methyltransferase
VPLPSKWWRWFFSRESKAWDRRSRNPAHGEIVRELVGLLEKGLTIEGAVVDVGCGPGAFGRAVPRPVVGVDLAPGMLERAAAHGGIALAQADLGEGLPFRDDAFAGALALLVLQHVDDVRAALAELRRVVARRGAIVLSVPTRERPPRRRMGLYWTLRPLAARVIRPIHFFTIDDLVALLTAFDVVELYTVRGVHVALLRNTKPL